MTFYLLWNEITNRMVIDRVKVTGYEIQKETRAKSWVEAKKLLGFELTPMQQRMLDAKDNSDKTDRGSVRHKQDAGSLIRAAYGELPDGGEALEDTGIDLQQVLCEEGVL